MRFLMYSAVSGLCLLIAVLAFGFFNANGFSFGYGDLATAELSPRARSVILALLLLAFGLKLPVVPRHGRQPFTYGQTATPVVMLLGGAVSKLGAYGLLRFGVGSLPRPGPPGPPGSRPPERPVPCTAPSMPSPRRTSGC